VLLRRPFSPVNASPQDAIAYLASACDGARKLDGHGFSADHVTIGHRLARTRMWSRRDRRAARDLIIYYRRQLDWAGFDVDTVLSGARPNRLGRLHRLVAEPAQWAVDPTSVHRWRYWNGRRWTHLVTDTTEPPNYGFTRGTPHGLAPGRNGLASRMVRHHALVKAEARR
jgi:hypothetical protein